MVAAAYVTTVPHPADAWFLVVQAAVTAILVGLIRRGGRKADAVIAVSLQAEQERQAEAAARADEREHHRQLHDTMLSTLTMVAAGAFAGPSATLSAQAARDLEIAAGSPAGPDAVRRVPPTCAPGWSRSRRRPPLRTRLTARRGQPAALGDRGHRRRASPRRCATWPGTPA